MQTSELIRRILAGAAIATLVSLPLADVAHAGTDTDTDTGGTDTDTDTDTVNSTTSTTRQVVQTTATTARAGANLARTGEDWAVPATLAGGGVIIALGARRLARVRGLG